MISLTESAASKVGELIKGVMGIQPVSVLVYGAEDAPVSPISLNLRMQRIRATGRRATWEVMESACT